MTDITDLAPALATDVPEATAASTMRLDCRPSGKPYSWQLPAAERPEFVALSQEALAERAGIDKEATRVALGRTAALFVVLSRNNGYEGRDPKVITDGLQCGTVADLLGFDIDMLARVLLEMKRRRLVTATDDGGLYIDDLDGLDRLSDAA